MGYQPVCAKQEIVTKTSNTSISPKQGHHFSKGREKGPCGAALMLFKEAAKSLIEWEPVCNRFVTTSFELRFWKVTIIQCYTATNNPGRRERSLPHRALKTSFQVPKRDMLILKGELNAKMAEMALA